MRACWRIVAPFFADKPGFWHESCNESSAEGRDLRAIGESALVELPGITLRVGKPIIVARFLQSIQLPAYAWIVSGWQDTDLHDRAYAMPSGILGYPNLLFPAVGFSGPREGKDDSI